MQNLFTHFESIFSRGQKILQDRKIRRSYGHAFLDSTKINDHDQVYVHQKNGGTNISTLIFYFVDDFNSEHILCTSQSIVVIFHVVHK